MSENSNPIDELQDPSPRSDDDNGGGAWTNSSPSSSSGAPPPRGGQHPQRQQPSRSTQHARVGQGGGGGGGGGGEGEDGKEDEAAGADPQAQGSLIHQLATNSFLSSFKETVAEGVIAGSRRVAEEGGLLSDLPPLGPVQKGSNLSLPLFLGLGFSELLAMQVELSLLGSPWNLAAHEAFFDSSKQGFVVNPISTQLLPLFRDCRFSPYDPPARFLPPQVAALLTPAARKQHQILPLPKPFESLSSWLGFHSRTAMALSASRGPPSSLPAAWNRHFQIVVHQALVLLPLPAAAPRPDAAEVLLPGSGARRDFLALADTTFPKMIAAWLVRYYLFAATGREVLLATPVTAQEVEEASARYLFAGHVCYACKTVGHVKYQSPCSARTANGGSSTRREDNRKPPSTPSSAPTSSTRHQATSSPFTRTTAQHRSRVGSSGVGKLRDREDQLVRREAELRDRERALDRSDRRRRDREEDDEGAQARQHQRTRLDRSRSRSRDRQGQGNGGTRQRDGNSRRPGNKTEGGRR